MSGPCRGCDIPVAERVNLPEGWKEGDPLPEGLTVHYYPGEMQRAPFAFRGHASCQDRVPMPFDTMRAVGLRRG